MRCERISTSCCRCVRDVRCLWISAFRDVCIDCWSSEHAALNRYSSFSMSDLDVKVRRASSSFSCRIARMAFIKITACPSLKPPFSRSLTRLYVSKWWTYGGGDRGGVLRPSGPGTPDGANCDEDEGICKTVSSGFSDSVSSRASCSSSFCSGGAGSESSESCDALPNGSSFGSLAELESTELKSLLITPGWSSLAEFLRSCACAGPRDVGAWGETSLPVEPGTGWFIGLSFGRNGGGNRISLAGP